jgi:hypothetical protein
MVDDSNRAINKKDSTAQGSDPKPEGTLLKTGATNTSAENAEKHKNRAKKRANVSDWITNMVWPKIKQVGGSSSFWTAAATVTIAVVTIFYTQYARKQWCAMEQALRQSDRHFEAEKRPWVAIDDANNQGITPFEPTIQYRDNKSKAVFKLRYVLANEGGRPANVIIHGGMMQHTDDFTVMLIRANQYCADGKQEVKRWTEKDWHWVVIPKFPMIFDVTYDSQPSVSGVEHGDVFDITQDMLRDKKMIPTNVGCIVYEAAGGNDKTIYTTPFFGALSMREKNGSVPPRNEHIPIVIGDGPSPDKLVVMETMAIAGAN